MGTGFRELRAGILEHELSLTLTSGLLIGLRVTYRLKVLLVRNNL